MKDKNFMAKKRFFLIVLCAITFPLMAQKSNRDLQNSLIKVPFLKGIKVDGKTGDWKISPAIKGLVDPWSGRGRDNTDFYVCHDKKNIYFLYMVPDTNIVYNAEKTESSVRKSDRVEFFLSKDDEMSTYYCVEINPIGKVSDYEAHYYRKFDYNWNLEGLKVSTAIKDNKYYLVEGSISLESLKSLGLISSENVINVGIYRANLLDENVDHVIWLSWIIPDAVKPDFHVPSTLGKFKLD